MPRAEVGRDVIHHPAVGEIAEHGRRVRVAADADALAHLGRAGRRVRHRAHQLETLTTAIFARALRTTAHQLELEEGLGLGVGRVREEGRGSHAAEHDVGVRHHRAHHLEAAHPE